MPWKWQFFGNSFPVYHWSIGYSNCLVGRILVFRIVCGFFVSSCGIIVRCWSHDVQSPAGVCELHRSVKDPVRTARILENNAGRGHFSWLSCSSQWCLLAGFKFGIVAAETPKVRLLLI